jgi:hypothetical protein
MNTLLAILFALAADPQTDKRAADFAAKCTPTSCTLTSTGERLTRVRWTVDGVPLADSLQRDSTTFRAYGPDTVVIMLRGMNGAGLYRQITKRVVVPGPVIISADSAKSLGLMPADTFVVRRGMDYWLEKKLGTTSDSGGVWLAWRWVYPAGLDRVPGHFKTQDAAFRALSTATVQP